MKVFALFLVSIVVLSLFVVDVRAAAKKPKAPKPSKAPKVPKAPTVRQPAGRQPSGWSSGWQPMPQQPRQPQVQQLEWRNGRWVPVQPNNRQPQPSRPQQQDPWGQDPWANQGGNDGWTEIQDDFPQEPVRPPVRPNRPVEPQRPVQPEQPSAGPASGNDPKTAPLQKILAEHNRHRALKGIAPLSWDNQLASIADNQATRGQFFEHSSCPIPGGCGQNLWAGTTRAYTPASMVQSWMDEGPENSYVCEPLTGSNFGAVGHYSQVMWANSKLVGCALSVREGQDYLVCNYSPPGNFMGQRPFRC